MRTEVRDGSTPSSEASPTSRGTLGEGQPPEVLELRAQVPESGHVRAPSIGDGTLQLGDGRARGVDSEQFGFPGKETRLPYESTRRPSGGVILTGACLSSWAIRPRPLWQLRERAGPCRSADEHNEDQQEYDDDESSPDPVEHLRRPLIDTSQQLVRIVRLCTGQHGGRWPLAEHGCSRGAWSIQFFQPMGDSRSSPGHRATHGDSPGR